MKPISSHRNNFDILRLLLSSLVIISHSYAFLGIEDQELLKVTVNLVFSGIGVSGFFVLSGFLIYQSVLNTASSVLFIKKRLLRIMPGLIAVVLLCTFVLGPLVSNLPINQYFSQSKTFSYFIKNIFLVPSDNTLPGVFQDNHLQEINGSLWTLRYEVLCYAGMLLFYLIPIAKHKHFALIAYTFLLAGNLITTYKWIALPPNINYHLSNLFTLTSYFYAGVLLHQYSAYWLPHVNKIALGSSLFALSLGLFVPHILQDVVTFLYPILILSIGATYSPKLQLGQKIGDISYGTYIYAYPIQQTLVMAGVSSLGLLLLLSFPLSWLAGWLSNHLVEKRFIYRRKNKLALASDALNVS